MDEQERTTALEELCGGPDKTFQLMRLYTAAIQTCSGDRNLLHRVPKRTPATVFEGKALDAGFSPEQVQAYLDYLD